MRFGGRPRKSWRVLARNQVAILINSSSEGPDAAAPVVDFEGVAVELEKGGLLKTRKHRGLTPSACLLFEAPTAALGIGRLHLAP